MALPDGPVNFYHSSAPVFPGPSSDGDKSKGAILTFKAPVDSPSLIHRYDVVARTWTNSSVQVLVPRRYGIDAVTDPHSGLVYLLGGYNTWLLDHMAVYDPHLDTLSSEALSNEKGSDQAQILGLAFYSAAWVPSLDQIIYVGGNSDNFPNKTTATIELYSPEKVQWTSVITTGDVPQSIDSACLVIDEARRQAVLFGGSGQAHDSNQIFFLDLNPESDSVFRWTQGFSTNSLPYNYFLVLDTESVGKVNNTIGEHQAPVIYDIITKQWVDKYNPLA
ncbi:hypothetical protein BGZ99_002039 [Dissophora globulifera]|uniref:Kelch repeat-containing protein n=1 Tax=Dissophora globulifera TaxID=979702 RepID=A0A9P6UXS7_9FUNG|nr:hypothetical protein BGZ99_002039 [Dissophora globulifera]